MAKLTARIQTDPHPKVTAFIPIYNAKSYVLQSIESVLQQTFSDFELLLLDDHSTDGTSELIGEFLKKHSDSRVRYHRFEQNMGVSSLGNAAINMAKGDFLFRLDADDVALPNRMQKQYDKMMENPQIHAMSSSVHMLLDDGEQIANAYEQDCDIKAFFLWATSNIVNPASFIRLSFIKDHHIKYNPTMRVAEDLNFWVDMAIKGASFYNIREPLIKYRIHPDQASQKPHPELAGNLYEIRKKILPTLFQHLSPSDVLIAAEFLTDKYLRPTYTRSEVEQAVAVLRKMLSMTEQSVWLENRSIVLHYVKERMEFWALKI